MRRSVLLDHSDILPRDEIVVVDVEVLASEVFVLECFGEGPFVHGVGEDGVAFFEGLRVHGFVEGTGGGWGIYLIGVEAEVTLEVACGEGEEVGCDEAF